MWPLITTGKSSFSTTVCFCYVMLFLPFCFLNVYTVYYTVILLLTNAILLLLKRISSYSCTPILKIIEFFFFFLIILFHLHCVVDRQKEIRQSHKHNCVRKAVALHTISLLPCVAELQLHLRFQVEFSGSLKWSRVLTFTFCNEEEKDQIGKVLASCGKNDNN